MEFSDNDFLEYSDDDMVQAGDIIPSSPENFDNSADDENSGDGRFDAFSVLERMGDIDERLAEKAEFKIVGRHFLGILAKKLSRIA